MQARVKADYRFKTILAFNRIEFVKSEWRAIPEGSEESARNHEALEVRDTPIEEPKADQVLDEILEGAEPTADKQLREMVGDDGATTDQVLDSLETEEVEPDQEETDQPEEVEPDQPEKKTRSRKKKGE